MNQQTIDVLGFHEVLQEVAGFARTSRAKDTIKNLTPIMNKRAIERMLEEVQEAVQILNISSSVPIHALDEMDQYIQQAKKGLYLRAVQFSRILSFLDHCRKLKNFMKDKNAAAPTVSLYAESIDNLNDLEDELNRCMRHGQLDDHASSHLASVRRQLSIQLAKLKDKAEGMAKSKKYANYLQDTMVAERNGRFVLLIKKEYRNKINGTVVDASASGATLFIEPNELSDMREEIDLLRLSEEREMERILYVLTENFLSREQTIQIAADTMHHYDVLFAKAKYSQLLRGTSPSVNEDYLIDLKRARHPMLKEKAVPLSLCFGQENRALVITGPNTGGKTVTLKTVGLLTMMAQSGLHIPADEGSTLHIYQQIFVDIGDGQSIAENLSTFSSRLVNIIEILQETNDHSLVLLDELGSGTDPGEGMGLAIVILEQLFEKGATLFATTHYSEMKEFADRKEGFLNGSMEFDLETLQPTYRLLLGESGKSQAFAIALKLGMHPSMIEKAYEITYKKEHPFTSKFDENELKEPRYSKQIATNKYARRAQTPKYAKASEEKVTEFEQGDNVTITATNETGIVYQGPDQKGNYIVQVKEEKQTINHKRLKLYIAAKELYPEDYDFDIIFKSKDYRKAKHQLDRKHVEGLTMEEE
ncbi:endonuclease MutS2 [Bacillus capparidis]|uniref:MutS2 family protein n=1 Tax=Bacillus capparidis TaxID=1840411 RepID=A0ABS4D2J3_9BACI|nr:endonuclease MutS2 [Bacillus capparidis]MBP1083850.1 MutS2 family protein [Bacillus capparidis]MED1098332.1 endonuclease MutS2 [Bacillus capparidis]